ncbi:MAG: glycosyltransferase [Candidatus Zixiibacteriota bacterium]|nr:MAG: glycosyltransferase [candidate division Zixibacteria bacterium]
MNEPIDIYIPCYQPDEYLDRCLRSIFKHTRGDYNVTVIVGKRSIAKNRNQGLRKSASEWICSLDADCEVTQDGWLELLLETARSRPEVGIVGAKIVMHDGKIFSAGTGPDGYPMLYGEQDTGQREIVEEVHAVSENCLLMRKGIFEFDEWFWQSRSSEGQDACIRLRQQGYKIIYDGRVKIQHDKYPRKSSPFNWDHIYFHLKHPSTYLDHYRKRRRSGK